jgi:glutamine synthetase
VDLDMYAEGHKVRGAKKLPLYLLDAIRLFDRDKGLKAAMGEAFSRSYVKIKMEEWNLYSQQLSAWERTASLDV